MTCPSPVGFCEAHQRLEATAGGKVVAFITLEAYRALPTEQERTAVRQSLIAKALTAGGAT